MGLTIEEAFDLSPEHQHHRHGEVHQHKDTEASRPTDEPQHHLTENERLLAELLRDEPPSMECRLCGAVRGPRVRLPGQAFFVCCSHLPNVGFDRRQWRV